MIPLECIKCVHSLELNSKTKLKSSNRIKKIILKLLSIITFNHYSSLDSIDEQISLSNLLI